MVAAYISLHLNIALFLKLYVLLEKLLAKGVTIFPGKNRSSKTLLTVYKTNTKL